MCGTKIIVEHRILCGDGILLENKILFAGRSLFASGDQLTNGNLLASAIPLGSRVLLQIPQILRRLTRRLENPKCNALFADIVVRDKICKCDLKRAKFKLRNL